MSQAEMSVEPCQIFRSQLFLQNVPSETFDRVLNMRLTCPINNYLNVVLYTMNYILFILKLVSRLPKRCFYLLQ